MNSTILGGYEVREALGNAYVASEIGTDLCVSLGGGCPNFKETPAGRQRFKELKRKHDELQQPN